MLQYIVIVLMGVSASADTNTNACETRCAGNSPVQVDVAGQCMCVGNKCFKVGIGHDGSMMTTSGVGKLKPTPPGEKYATHPSDSTGYDNDAVAMGINANDVVGKWLHKPANCVNAETYRTKGCIAVPCDVWPMVKKAMREESELTVCNGRGKGPMRPPNSGREWNEDTQQFIER